MANVFEIHAEECRAAMVAQAEAIATAQKTLVNALAAVRLAEDALRLSSMPTIIFTKERKPT